MRLAKLVSDGPFNHPSRGPVIAQIKDFRSEKDKAIERRD